MGLFNRKPKEEPIVEEQGQESSDQVGQETPAGANLPDDVQQLFAATENIKQEKLTHTQMSPQKRRSRRRRNLQ